MKIMPYVLASGKPLVLVTGHADYFRYVLWRPGKAEVQWSSRGQDWDTVFPASELKPIGWGLPITMTSNPETNCET